ncbi:MAG TPA: alkaline phosphatase family protein [Candidatus Limnocylindrales bacterium]|nr:alkaline phosphatase family protein [Candidatus Limnocylindrales bacterium]
MSSRDKSKAPLILTASRTLTRRRFLTELALAGGAAALGWPRWSGAQSLPFDLGIAPLPQNTPVDHIFVLMMENRSFDHYMGWRTGTNQQHYTGTYDDPENPLDGQTVATHALAPDYRGCNFGDPSHGWEGGRSQLRSGFLSGDNDEFAIGYYNEADVEFYAKLAGEGVLCDNYFASLLGPTFPNREYMHSAQSGGIKTNALPPEIGYSSGFTWATIWDRLEAAGVPWGYYHVDLPAALLWGPRLAKGVHPIAELFADAAAGTLPKVAFIDPGFTTGLRTDEHPHGDMRAGQAFSHNVVKAIVESPLWPRSVLFVNYDEWGGFFDHVRPPRMPDARGTDSDPAGLEDFGQLGFRVPTMILSPYAAKGVLSSSLLGIRSPKSPPPGKLFAPTPSRFYDHTSILKYIEWRFGLAPLTARDAAAANIGLELLDFTQTPRLDAAEIVDALPRSVVTSQPCPGEELDGLPVEPPEEIKDAFAHALESGYFESVGWDGNLPSLDDVLGI